MSDLAVCFLVFLKCLYKSLTRWLSSNQGGVRNLGDSFGTGPAPFSVPIWKSSVKSKPASARSFKLRLETGPAERTVLSLLERRREFGFDRRFLLPSSRSS